MQYLIVWKIDIDADSPGEATLRARQIQEDVDSTALSFELTDENGKCFEVDLWNETVQVVTKHRGDI